MLKFNIGDLVEFTRFSGFSEMIFYGRIKRLFDSEAVITNIIKHENSIFSNDISRFRCISVEELKLITEQDWMQIQLSIT